MLVILLNFQKVNLSVMLKKILGLLHIIWLKIKVLSVYCWNFLVWVKKPTLTIVKYILSGVVLGIITGIIVAYLLSTPTIGLTNTKVLINDDNIDLLLEFENKGKNKASNVSIRYLYGLEGMEPKDFFVVKTLYKADVIEIGDVFKCGYKGLTLHKEGEIAILYLMIRYSDQSRIRQFINERLLGNQYSLEKWMAHYEEKKVLSALPQEIKKKYKHDLRNIILQLF